MRIIEIVQKSIEMDILTSEANIERLMNDDTKPILDVADEIKINISKVIHSQLMLAKWNNYSNNIMVNIKADDEEGREVKGSDIELQANR